MPSVACALCGHPAETKIHIQCLCPALKEARIRAHHNMAHRLWRGIEDSTRVNPLVESIEDSTRVAGGWGLLPLTS